jgi:quercetin dioxygenase-like cupin family protein
VPIDFLDLLADDGWAPVPVVPEGSGADWAGGGTLAAAPVDATSTFAPVRRSTGIDPSFGLHGVRLPPSWRGPERRHDQPLLMIVVAGEVVVRERSEGDGEGSSAAEQRVRAGEFCVIDEGTVHSVSAGPDGVTYTECWPQDVDGAATTWYPGDAWAEDGGQG